MSDELLYALYVILSIILVFSIFSEKYVIIGGGLFFLVSIAYLIYNTIENWDDDDDEDNDNNDETYLILNIVLIIILSFIFLKFLRDRKTLKIHMVKKDDKSDINRINYGVGCLVLSIISYIFNGILNFS